MRKNITVEFTNERIIPSVGLAVVGAILGKNDFVKRRNRMKVDCNHPQHQIKNGDIMLTYIGMQCMGKPSFEAVHEMDDGPEFLKETIGICHQLTDEPLFFRLDSGNDSAENIGILMENGCHFIIKRNLRKESKEDWLKMAEEHSLDISHPRDGKTVYIGSNWKGITYRTEDSTEKQATIRMGYEITERTMDKNGR